MSVMFLLFITAARHTVHWSTPPKGGGLQNANAA